MVTQNYIISVVSIKVQAGVQQSGMKFHGKV